jgi:hypothetical protein
VVRKPSIFRSSGASKKKGASAPGEETVKEDLTQAQRAAVASITNTLTPSDSRFVLYEAVRSVIRLQDTVTCDQVVKDVLLLLHKRKEMNAFVELSLREEIKACQQKNTLFREASVFVNCMSVLYKDRASRRFLDAVVQPVCESLIQHGVQMSVKARMAQVGARGADAENATVQGIDDTGFLEIDADKLGGDVAQAAKNAFVLQQHASMLLQNVRIGAHVFPPTLRHFLFVLHDEVKARFPGSEWNIYSSMVFLRFIVPNLIMPAKADSLPAGLRKSLLRIGRIVQAHANEVLFGADDAEAVFNPWLERQEPVGIDYFVEYVNMKNVRLGEPGDILVPKAKAKSVGAAMASFFGGRKNSKGTGGDGGLEQPVVLSLHTCKSIAASRHAFLASLEARPETKGRYEWLQEFFEAVK